MIVKDLIVELLDMDPELEVIMQKDSEGNGYSPLAGADPDGIYIPDSTWSGVVYDSQWTAEEADMDEEEWQEILSKPRAVILFPTD